MKKKTWDKLTTRTIPRNHTNHLLFCCNKLHYHYTRSVCAARSVLWFCASSSFHIEIIRSNRSAIRAFSVAHWKIGLLCSKCDQHRVWAARARAVNWKINQQLKWIATKNKQKILLLKDLCCVVWSSAFDMDRWSRSLDLPRKTVQLICKWCAVHWINICCLSTLWAEWVLYAVASCSWLIFSR